MIVFDVEGVGELTFKAPRWPEFRDWWHSTAGGTLSDGAHNLAIACAVSPGPAELASIFEDMGFLSTSIASALLDHTGAPETGFSTRYPVVSADQAPPALVELAKQKTKRPLYVQTPAGVWALRPPSAGAAGVYVDAHQAALAHKPGASLPDAARTLVLSCVLSPEPEVARAAIDQNPAIPFALHEMLAEHGGAGKAIARVKG